MKGYDRMAVHDIRLLNGWRARFPNRRRWVDAFRTVDPASAHHTNQLRRLPKTGAQDCKRHWATRPSTEMERKLCWWEKGDDLSEKRVGTR